MFNPSIKCKTNNYHGVSVFFFKIFVLSNCVYGLTMRSLFVTQPGILPLLHNQRLVINYRVLPLPERERDVRCSGQRAIIFPGPV